MVFIAPELSRLATEAEAIVWLQTQSFTHHHDLSEAVITGYEENVKKLEDVFKANDPFANEENELINMNTKAVMPVTVKEVQKVRTFLITL